MSMRTPLFVLMMMCCAPSYGEKPYEQSATHTSHHVTHAAAKIARQWGITEEEAIRYHEIMSGPLGKWNPTIDPVMALGIYAKTEADRKRYAEIYAMQEHQLTEMTQQFQQEYDKAFKRLFPNAKIIDPVLLKPYYAHKAQKDKLSGRTPKSSFKTGDKVLYFVDIDCQACRSQLRKLENIITQAAKRLVGVSVDIYVVSAKTEDDVRQWAVDNHINVDLVTRQLITLNLDKGLQKKLNSASDKSSDFYLLRNDKTFAVNPDDIGL